MIKICYITTISLTLEKFILCTAEYLHENTNWDISVICDNDDKFAEHIPEYIHYYPVPMRRGISLTGIKSMFKIKKIFQREKFDLIQYSTPNAALYSAIAGTLAKIPVRLYCQWGMIFVGFSGLKRQIFKLEEKIVCRLSTWIEPDSKSNLQFAHNMNLYPKAKGSVIWNGSACGVDLDRFDISQKSSYRNLIRERLGIPEHAFVFGYVGRITKDKGVNELFKASMQIMKHNKNVFLLLVGQKESCITIDQVLYQWSLEDKRVIYAGYTEAVEQFLSAMDCYILPSYREGFGMSVVEAEAMGVPVIVTDIPGPTDAMENKKTGLIVKKADARTLVKAMNFMLEDKKELQKYSVNGVLYVRERFEQKKLLEYIKLDREKLLGSKQ